MRDRERETDCERWLYLILAMVWSNQTTITTESRRQSKTLLHELWWTSPSLPPSLSLSLSLFIQFQSQTHFLEYAGRPARRLGHCGNIQKKMLGINIVYSWSEHRHCKNNYISNIPNVRKRKPKRCQTLATL